MCKIIILWGHFAEIVFIGEWWSSSTCAILTDDETWSKMGKEHAIVIMNHSFEVDWLMGWLVCEQSRLLAVSYVNLGLQEYLHLTFQIFQYLSTSFNIFRNIFQHLSTSFNISQPKSVLDT